MMFLLSTYMLGVFITLPPFQLNVSLIVKGIAISLGFSGLFSLIYLFYSITDDYIYRVKNRAPNLFNYFIVLFHFGFFPI
ncbi:hypothetical protein EV194_12023 [Natronoflexus pectinivorans]|uniref:Uncharacterized protein n=1 Tax=Natronoflexus pectinivorans TaxID=682526 RepID=A0A4R2G780_9BACT|nr:hypothetical protein EV194_12023 [Natronoflexus pectinivorans]